MAILFVSHASEDKDAFVRPLAKALNHHHTVWFDEYELHVGDSLRGKIDDGLKKCDFGVVVLSRAFFKKNWTRMELDGLLALESDTRKIILPVWYDVTKEEVTGFSPMLAGRLGAHGSKGISSVVDEINSAVAASERTREITNVSKSRASLRALTQSLEDKEAEKLFLHSENGVQAAISSAAEVRKRLTADVEVVNREAGTQRFVIKPGNRPTEFGLFGPYRVCAVVSFYSHFRNSLNESKLIARIGIRGHYDEKPVPVDEFTWNPRGGKDGVVRWQLEDTEEIVDTAGVAAKITASFTKSIQEQADEERER